MYIYIYYSFALGADGRVLGAELHFGASREDTRCGGGRRRGAIDRIAAPRLAVGTGASCKLYDAFIKGYYIYKNVGINVVVNTPLFCDEHTGTIDRIAAP